MSKMTNPDDHFNDHLDYGPLKSMVGLEVRKAQSKAAKAFANEVDLTLLPGHLTALILIQNNPGQTQSAIAKACGLDRSSFAPLIKQFEQQELVKRHQSVGDSRAKTMKITQKGIDYIASYLPAVETLEARVKTAMGERDYKRFIQLLIKFQAKLVITE